jgi:fucose permease
MAYAGLVIGTVIFSAANGFAEVLISPVIAAMPAKDPDREMSKLHSVYAWGVVGVVLFATLFLVVCGRENWQLLTILFTLIPLLSFVLYLGSEIPPMETPEKVSGVMGYLKNRTLWLCVLAIFLGGAAECTMAQWCSGYLERAVGIPKVWGDLFGVALFSVMLGLGRTLYAKYGKNAPRVLFLCAVGATLCYLTAALVGYPLVGLAACALTGLCVSMLWPGCLIVAADRFPTGGVFLYAMMAAGGDLGASVGPQLVGIITDAALVNPTALSMAERLALTPDQLGMKLGMLVGMLFPLIAVFLFLRLRKSKKAS